MGGLLTNSGTRWLRRRTSPTITSSKAWLLAYGGRADRIKVKFDPKVQGDKKVVELTCSMASGSAQSGDNSGFPVFPSLKVAINCALRVARTRDASWAAGPATASMRGRFRAKKERDATSSFSAAQAPDPLGASAAPGKTDAAVDISEKDISASPNTALQSAMCVAPYRDRSWRWKAAKELDTREGQDGSRMRRKIS